MKDVFLGNEPQKLHTGTQDKIGRVMANVLQNRQSCLSAAEVNYAGEPQNCHRDDLQKLTKWSII